MKGKPGGRKPFGESKKKMAEEKINPFELKKNKKKHDVMGQKVKGEMGNRGFVLFMLIQKYLLICC